MTVRIADENSWPRSVARRRKSAETAENPVEMAQGGQDVDTPADLDIEIPW